MHKSVALGISVARVLGHLAAQDVAKSRKGIVHGLVVYGLVEVLDEDVAHAYNTNGDIQ
jgi:hypothetical protein